MYEDDVDNEEVSAQVLYKGRWFNRKNFRVYVYDKNKNQKMANSYNEYEKLVSSGLWFDSIELATKDNLSKNGIVVTSIKETVIEEKPLQEKITKSKGFKKVSSFNDFKSNLHTGQ